MHELSFFSFFLDFSSSTLLACLSVSDHLSIQMKSNDAWFACTYRILHVQCLLLKARRRVGGWWWCWWAPMCSPIDIKQSSDMEMGGQAKNGFSLRLCLHVGQGLPLPLSPSIFLSPSFLFSVFLNITYNLFFFSSFHYLLSLAQSFLPLCLWLYRFGTLGQRASFPLWILNTPEILLYLYGR